MQIVINDRLVNYQVINPEGKKNCIVLHGWGQNSNIWVPVAKMLPQDYKYWLIDLPGFGGSQVLPMGSDVPEYSEVIFEFIQKKQISKPVVVGHSFGGQIAVDMAVKSPDKLTKLILVSAAVIRKRTGKQKVKVWLYKNFSVIKPLIPEKLLRRILALVTSSDYYGSSEELKSVLRNIVEYRLEDKLSQIQIPVKIIWGEQDHEIPYMGKEMMNLLPHGELYVMYGVGHNPQITNLEELVQVVTNTLEVR